MTLPRLAVIIASLVSLGAAVGCGATDTTTATGDRSTAVRSTPATSVRGRRHHRTAGHRKRAVHRMHHPRRKRGVVHAPRVPQQDVPDLALTPGAVLTTSTSRICASGYSSSVRNVPSSEKEEVYAEYDIPHVPYQHEVDHLVSLELGGSNAITNLWPEPYAGRWGARTKDALENRLHDLVCAGRLGLTSAQHIEATNWVGAYRRYVGGAPSAPPTNAAPSGGGSGGSGGGAGCTPGYSPCLLDRGGDYDCSSGSGNGPYYTRPGVTYTVTGADRYGLDGNGDGRACG